LRIGESRFVIWGDCDFKRGEIIVRGHPETGTKNSEFRRVPMIPDMRNLLEIMRGGRPDEIPETPVMRVWECQKSIDRASKLLGIKRITHHDLRHLFATRCIESGVDIPTVSRWLCHKDGVALAMKTYPFPTLPLRRQRACGAKKLDVGPATFGPWTLGRPGVGGADQRAVSGGMGPVAELLFALFETGAEVAAGKSLAQAL
jgi:hypothetical protein